MKLYAPLLTLLASFIFFGCEDEKPEEDVPPSVKIIKPVNEVQLGEQIPITLEFEDDKGLANVEISLGSEEHSNVAYHYTTRGLSGRKDQLSYMVDPPVGMDILGSNYILITCRDKGGNATVADETFMVVDGRAPDGFFVYTDTVLGAGGRAEVVYEASDNEALKKVELEMWQVSAQGTQIKMLDFATHDPAGVIDLQKQHFFDHKPSYQAGDNFRFYLKITDNSGNLTQVAAPALGVFL